MAIDFDQERERRSHPENFEPEVDDKEPKDDDDDQDPVEECFHICTSNCRRNGCNCLCGEFHE